MKLNRQLLNLRMSLPEGSCPIEDQFRNSEISVCIIILKWGLSFLEHRQTSSNLIGDGLSRR